MVVEGTPAAAQAASEVEEPEVIQPAEEVTPEAGTEEKPEAVAPEVAPEEVAAPEVQTTPEPEKPAPVPAPGKETLDPNVYDENGVPWRNRAAEWKRKVGDVAESLPDLINNAVQTSMQKQDKLQYSIEQLEQFAAETDQPGNAAWARGEIRRMEKEGQAEVVKREINSWKQEQSDRETVRNSFNYAVAQYPECFVRDKSGRITGQWNNNHPLTQGIAIIMQDPRLKGNPDALAIASDIAYGRFIKSKAGQSAAANSTLKNEVKSLQRKTLVEPGTKTVTRIATPHRKAIDKFKQSGSLKDATEAMKAIYKAREESA